MKRILFSTFILSAFVFAVSAQHDHEYAPITEKEIEYKDWTYKNVLTNKDINLRKFAEEKKLVMVFYFAPWCHSSNFQAPIIQKLYRKYKKKGFAVIGVSIYGSIAHVRYTIKTRGISFPVVSESLTLGERKRSLHYKYRWSTGDYRKWGTPWNIFLVPSELAKTGDTLTKTAFVVNGEIVEKEAEKHIRKKLGLPTEEAKAK